MEFRELVQKVPSDSPNDLFYIGSAGDVLEFTAKDVSRLGDGDTLRSRKWSRSLGYRSVTWLVRPAFETSIEVIISSLDLADKFRRVMDYDVSTGNAGILSLGGWCQRALVVESSTDTWRPSTVVQTLTVALLDGVWHKRKHVSIMPAGQESSTYGVGYPHGFPYDFGRVTSPGTFKVDGYLPAPATFTIYGPVSNPVITIAENEYRFHGDIPDGGHLILDGLSKTATLVNQYGHRENAMVGVELGGGVGSGKWAFEKIPAGTHRAMWSGGFGFDIDIWQEEGEPSWT